MPDRNKTPLTTSQQPLQKKKQKKLGSTQTLKDPLKKPTTQKNKLLLEQINSEKKKLS